MTVPLQVRPTEIPGLLEIETRVFADARGFFMEIYVEEKWKANGLDVQFVQDNVSMSSKGTLRGMHYQINPHGMGKYVRVIRGSVYDVAIDIRRGSPTFGKWVGRTLTASSGLGLWIPVGFAHGFLALEDETIFLYKCTEIYTPAAERSLHYADPAVGVVWPEAPTHLSPRDEQAPALNDAEFNFLWAE